jgi:hypothetical protein
VAGEAFGFHVELEGAERSEVEDLVEGGDRRVRDRDLVREVGEGVRAAVVLLDLREREGADDGARGQRRAVALALVAPGLGDSIMAGRLGEEWRVRDNQHIVFGHGEVEFQDIRADFDAVVKAGKGVLRPVGAAAAMGVHKYGAWGRRRAGRSGSRSRLGSRLGRCLGRCLYEEGRGSHQSQCGQKRTHRVQGGGVALKQGEHAKAGGPERPTAPSAEEAKAVARFKELTEHALPTRAQEEHWPVRFDHCFKRICLDWTFGDVWYRHLARPAERHLRGDQLQRAVMCAEALLDGGLPVLRERDAASLRWRGKRPKAERCAS